jgi:hypothetical protein
MKKISLVLALIINLLILTPIYSQIDLKLIIRNPTPSDIYEWQQDPTIVQLIVNNQSTNDYQNATFGFKITNEEGTLIAESKYNSPTARRFYIPTLVTSINGPQIIDVNSISFNRKALLSNSTAFMSSLALPTSIPEGFYEICISIYDQKENNITNYEEYCTNFTVLIPEPPIIISPMDDEFLISPFPNFIWTPVTNYSTGRNQIKYKLKICPVYKGQSPRTAIDRNPVLLEKNDLLTTSYIYMPSDMPFDYFKDVERFVWMVQAFDQDGKPATKNQGRSELGTFRLKDESQSQISLTNIYPSNNDTVPWTVPHLVTKYAPYSDDISSIEFTLRFFKDGDKTEFTNTRKITFNGGPKAGQQLNSIDLASLLVTHVGTNKVVPDWMKQLQPGVKYNWKVDVEFTLNDGSVQNASSQETSFYIGFKKPTLKKPVKDTSIKVNTKINCIFSIPRPESLNFENVDALTMPGFHASGIRSQALNKFSVEISKKSSFDTIVQTKTKTIPESQTYFTGDTCDDLFNDITVELDGIKDTCTYYYRLNYLNNADQKYFTSTSKSIKIVPDSIITCFEMLVQSPKNNGEWPSNKNPQFAVSINPEINKSAITGGRIRVWKKDTHQQSITDAKKEKPVLDTTFTGTDTSKIFAFTTDMAGYTKYNLNFINGDSTSKTFKVKQDTSYVWNFKLNYKKDSIRKDKLLCNSDSLVSNDGVFKVVKGDDEENSCPGDCEATAPTNTTAGTQTLAKDSTITIGKFKLKLNNISGSASHLSGDGTINVPYLRSDIKVEFNGLQVNSDNVVFFGEAYAQIDEDADYKNDSSSQDFEGKALKFAEGALKFKKIYEHSSSAGKLISGLTGTEPVTLPLGYDKDINGFKTVLCIIAMKFTPTRGSLNLATYVTMPSLGTDVGFGLGAKNICFHDDGFGGREKAILYLAQDFGYNNDSTWSMLFKAPTPTDLGTYLACDCKTFNKMTIAGEVEFPRSWLKTIDSDSTKLVKAYFKTIAEKSGNGWQWMASANLDECELSGADGYKMQVQEMVFDYSIDKNPEGITFPAIYTGKKTNLWKGFYIKRAWVSFPDDIKTFDEGSPKLSVSNVIIDKSGFTASICGENVIQYPKGNFGNWGASIDTIKIDLVSSSLQSGSMKGRIKVSIIDSSLLYKGLLAKSSSGKNYQWQLSVFPKDSVSIDLWKSKLHLDSTSNITLGNTTGKFVAKAELDGKLTLDGDLGKLKKLNFKGIKFEGFKVMSNDPYFEKGNWGFASPPHEMSGFPVNIGPVNIVTGSRSGGYGIGIQFGLDIALQSGSNAISGKTKLSVWGKLASESGAQSFVFDGVELDSIGVNADLGSIKFSGGLEVYDSDPIFGDGFRGVVSASFINQMSVMATAQFGSVNNYRYWYVDAKAIFSEAVPVFTGLGMYGFGGGAWYHMQRSDIANFDLTDPISSPDSSKTAGTTNSGCTFVPNKSVELGLKASLILGTHPKPNAFNCDVSLEAQFNNGGIETVSLIGDGYLMCGITDRGNSKLRSQMNLKYAFLSNTLSGTVDVNIVDAEPVTGHGQMEIYFAPSKWYLKMGQPSNTIEVGLANLANVEGYFMIGQDLPTPTIPTYISSEFPQYSVSRSNVFELGDGIAFGARAGFDTGPKTYSIFYGEFSAMLGFDMALLNYGTGTHCKDMDGPIGINGWYASGQMYAYLSASIGLHVDLWFKEGNFNILSLSGGALLEGAGPNPTWVKGMVEGNYSILGGAVHGDCSFKFSHGDQCEFVQENPLKIDLITDISPTSETTNVDVMIEPQVATTFPINGSFELKEMQMEDEPPIIRTYRVRLKDYNLIKESNNDTISGRINIAPDDHSAYFSSYNMLSGNTNYKVDVTAYGEEYINNAWSPAVKNDGTAIEQSANTSFKTGPAPDKIRKDDVTFTYPVNNQKFFLQDECRSGKVQLKTGMDPLFTPSIHNNIELIARFIPTEEGIESIEVPFTYNSTDQSASLRFDIPDLQNITEYNLQFVKEISTEESEGRGFKETKGSNTSEQEKTVSYSKSNSVFITERKIVDKGVQTTDKIMYAIRFKTSQYNTLEAKLNSFNYITTESSFYDNIFEVHRAVYEGDESFGYFDMKPTYWTKSGASHTFGPLVKTNGDFRRTSTWHNTFANPLVYNKIAWMSQKGWWYMHVDGYSMTEYLLYTSSSLSLNLVDIEANGNYTPIVEPEGANLNVYAESAPAERTTAQAGRTTTQAGRTTTQAGRTTTQAGKTTTQAGRANAQAGRTTTQAGRATAQTGSTAAQAGRTTAQTGSTAAQAGRTTAQTGSTAAQAGRTTAQTGSTAAQAGRITAQTGSTAAQAGRTTAQTGSTTTQAGRTTTQTGRATAQTSGAYSNSAVTSAYNTGGLSGSEGSSSSGFTPSDVGKMSFDELKSVTMLTLTPNIILTYNHGKVIATDYLTLRNKAISILTNQDIYISDSDLSKLRSIFYTNYQLMPKGNYPLKFKYNYRGCLGPDAQTPMIDKPFIY